MSTKIEIPKRLPVLLVTEGVVFPTGTVRIPVRTNKNINMVEQCLSNMVSLQGAVIAVAYKEPLDKAEDKHDRRLPPDYHNIGTAAIVTQVVGTNWPKPSYTLQVTGLCRIRIEEILRTEPFLIASVTQLDKMPSKPMNEKTEESKKFLEDIWKLLELISPRSTAVERLKRILKSAPLDVITDMCASIIEFASYREKLNILDAVTMDSRIKLTHQLVKNQLKHLAVSNSPDDTYTVEVFPESARVDELSKILGRLMDGNKGAIGFPKDNRLIPKKTSAKNEKDELLQRLKDVKMPEEVEKIVMSEFEKLKNTSSFSPEYTSLRNYLELIADLPWSCESEDILNIKKARSDMDEDHFGLEDVKKRVLEYFAVRQLRKDLKGPILCFVGPPGVGKTSIAKSIARTLGRKFHRISLGGVCDQSDIRGHRRTYIGSMPGRIIQGLKVAKTKNPVFLLDEVDKTTAGIHGDPASALLEVLDPEQNAYFVDHYVNAPFDLSHVLFLATANTIDTIPAPLLDRMEVIRIAGYTQEEKVHIATNHLVPKQLKEHGLTTDHLKINHKSLAFIVRCYTREAGVRNLERKLGAICRAVALRISEWSSGNKTDSADSVNSISTTTRLPDLPIILDENAVEDILGPPTFDQMDVNIVFSPGIAAGLAWTPVGGELMFVEATKMPGDGKLVLTGQLGDIMKESANLALNWLRSHSTQLGQDSDFAQKTDIHVHFPAGAISKDGPSAGITVLVTLVSLFTNRCVRQDTAMTGEITLRGSILPVGGIKDKVLAAHRAGFRRVILPRRNEKDLVDISAEVKNEMKIVLVEKMEEALNEAFEGGFPKLITSKL